MPGEGITSQLSPVPTVLPSCLLPSPLYLVDVVQMQRLATEPQKQGQELGAEVVRAMRCQEGSLSGLPRLAPPTDSPLSSQGENDRVELTGGKG